jgi:hypothetical protein
MRRRAASFAALVIFLLETVVFVAIGQQGEAGQPTSQEMNGERVLKALAVAYPDRIREVSRREGDWAASIDGEWYYWANGRLLASELRPRWESYAEYRFYKYPRGVLPPLAVPDEKTIAGLKAAVSVPQSASPARWEGFMDALLETGSLQKTMGQIVKTSLLGFSVEVHAASCPRWRKCRANARRSRKATRRSPHS